MTMNDSLGDALICAWRMDGAGGAVKLALDDHPANAPGFDWIHLDANDPRACDWLAKKSGAPDFAVTALTAEETRPRFEPAEQGALVNLRGVNHNPGAEPEDMVSVRMWVTPTRVITSRRFKLMAVRDLRDDIEKGDAPVTPGDLIARLALRLSLRIEPVIAEMVDIFDELEDDVFDDGKSIERIAVTEPRSEAAQIRRYIAPQREALRALAATEAGWIREEDHRIFHEAAEAMARLTEDLDSLRERAMVLHDLLVSQQADRMNRHTMVLSLAAGIFLPVTLIAGMLGMNVAGVPLSDHPNGFWIVSGLLTLICVIELAFFKWAKWI